MLFLFFFLMIRRPPRSTRTDTLFPYTTLFRSQDGHIIAKIDIPASGFFTVAAFSDDGRQVVIGDWAKCAWLWRLADHRVLTLSGNTAAVRPAMFSRDAALVLTAGDARSEERRVGKECVRTCMSRGWP